MLSGYVLYPYTLFIYKAQVLYKHIRRGPLVLLVLRETAMLEP